MNFGLRQNDLNEIIRTLKQFSNIEQAIIFGSRAKGNYKRGSDVDIAIKGKEINHETVSSISFQLNEESDTPYYFDIVHYENISENALIDHIGRVGKCIYSRKII